MNDVSAETTLSIAANGTLSGASGDIKQHTLAGLYVSAWATSAVMTFDVSYDGTTYAPLVDKDGEYTVAAASTAINSGTTHIALDPAKFASVRKFKVRSGTKASTVPQVAGVTTIIPLIRTFA